MGIFSRFLNRCSEKDYRAQRQVEVLKGLNDLKAGNGNFKDDRMVMEEDQEAYEAIKAQIEALKKKKRQLNISMAEPSEELEANLRKLEEQTEELETELLDAKDELRALRTARPVKQEELVNWKQEKEDLQDQIKDLREEINMVRDKRARLIEDDEVFKRRQLSNVDKSIKNLEDAMHSMEIPGAKTAETKRWEKIRELEAERMDHETFCQREGDLAVRRADARGKYLGPILGALATALGGILVAKVKGTNACKLQDKALNAGELPASRNEPYNQLR